MIKPSLYIILATVALCFLQCKKGFFGDGKMITSDRPASPFAQVILYDNVNLVLAQDSVERIRVEAPEKIEPFITTEIIDQALWIRNRNTSLLLSPGEKINVYVSVRSLGRLDYHGAGRVSCTNTLKKDYFVVVSADGSGDLFLNLNTIQTQAFNYSDATDFIFRGKSDTCYTYCGPTGTIDYKNFEVKKLGIDYSSIRDAFIQATETLNGRIYYKGNVYYSGNPATTQLASENSGQFIAY